MPEPAPLLADHQGWTAELHAEFRRNEHNGHVGGRLIEQTRWTRLWEIHLRPGERLPAHRHVLDYSWTAVHSGLGRQHSHDGTTREVTYRSGDSRFLRFPAGHFLLHDLENIGSTPLLFITTEFLTSPNPPLPL
ncbi:hypothetical protein M8C13_22045 [Crossiella sp. SN42]|uniref:cupin domain-containing protein n=1 Tax=Crossiella sp. SN42 TaxID=2944808 RepID=UPI00207D70F7|nr:hypothetical protein [Crossiella sp. SN42]MCO1578437.1 hypothetical protein [Crossiella sp. SN42]